VISQNSASFAVSYFISTFIEEMLDFDGLPERFNPDDITFHELKACEICEQTFNMTIRRHHCRRCGKSVCSKCSGNMKPLSKADQKTAYRICDACDTEIENFKVLLNRIITNMNS
jgi:hypothetical protein